VNHIHQNEFIHNDLKPENILLKYKNDGDEIELKIADFGGITYIG